MPAHPYRNIAVLAGSILLPGLLISGCATEKALTEQTKPLQEQVARLEQDLSASNKSTLHEAQEQSAGIAARQASLESRITATQAEVQGLTERLNALDANIKQIEQRENQQSKALAAQADQTDIRLGDIAAAAKEATRQLDALKATQAADAIAATSLAARLAQAEQTLNVQARSISEHANAVTARQDADTAARTGTESILAGRVDQIERHMKDLTALAQEAMAQASKEIFLANGKEAFTVTLTDDKVLYPQNDPNVDAADAAKLEMLAKQLVTLGTEYHLDIQGHTDNFSTDDNNYNLGKARAEVMKRYLHEKGGISISRMSTISYGANKPVNPAGNNRRIFIRVLVLK